MPQTSRQPLSPVLRRISRIQNQPPPAPAESKCEEISAAFFLFLICLCGLICHSAFVTIKYTNYETGVDVVMKIGDYTRPPALSICLQDPAFKTVKSYSMASFMNGTEEFFSQAVNELPWLPVKTNRTFFWANDRKCMKLNTVDEFVPITGRQELRSLIFFLELNHSKIGKRGIHLYFHDRDSYPYQDDVTLLSMSTKSVKSLYLTYITVQDELLGLPFSPRCTNYHKDGTQSRGHCIEQCMDNRYPDQCLYTVHLNGSYGTKKLTDPFLFDEEDYEACKQLCYVGCKTKLYSPVWALDYDSNKFIVKVYNHRPATRITQIPTLSLYEYIIYLGSLLGLFLGCSLLDISLLIYNVSKRVVIWLLSRCHSSGSVVG